MMQLPARICKQSLKWAAIMQQMQKDVRHNFKNYFISNIGEVQWQYDYVRRGRLPEQVI